MKLRIGFFGACGTVTGSRYVLEPGNRRLLVDCGLFQGFKQLRRRNWAPTPFGADSIGAVVLTHAHIDHSGYIPRLVATEGYKGPIHCSPATLELCRILLPDSGYLQEEDARYANAHGFSRHQPALPLYTRAQAEACLEQFVTVRQGRTFEPMPGISVRFYPAGHILGACFVRIEYKGVSITFSGDVGRPHDALMNAPAPLPATDYLVIESTYGDRRHPDIDPEAEIGEWLRKACARGGVVVIPAFAVGRTQALLWHIASLKQKGELPDVPVYLDSPMAIDATTLYQVFADEHRLSTEDCRALARVARFVNSPEESRALDRSKGPMIIVAAAGMATGGRVLHHLKAFVGEERNLILFSGYQAPGTRGAALVGGARVLRMHGQEFTVKAQVAQLQASSSHADADELLAWMRTMPAAPKKVFVTHGEPAAADALRYRIEHELNWPVEVPEYRDFHEL